MFHLCVSYLAQATTVYAHQLIDNRLSYRLCALLQFVDCAKHEVDAKWWYHLCQDPWLITNAQFTRWRSKQCIHNLQACRIAENCKEGSDAHCSVRSQ